MPVAKLPWVERTFSFTCQLATYPDVVERFRGTPARIDEKVRVLPREVLTRSDGKGWTIQENIGHLLDLETLFDGRLDDFLAGAPMLRAADMSNRATKEGGFNAREIHDLLREFRRAREHQAERLDALEESDFARISTHPRLKIPMRLIDAVTFVCQHDDYHLARMSELARALTPT